MAMTMPAMIVVKMTTGADARDWKKGIFPVRRKCIMKILYRVNSQYFLFLFHGISALKGKILPESKHLP